MQFLRTIALIFLIYFGIKVVMRLFSTVKKGGNTKSNNSATAQPRSKSGSKKPNFNNTEIEDADFEEIK